MKNSRINTLPFQVQKEIYLELANRGLYEEDIKIYMNGRLCDIDDIINIDKYTEEVI